MLKEIQVEKIFNTGNNDNNQHCQTINTEIEQVATFDDFQKDWIGAVHDYQKINERWQTAGKYIPKVLALIVGSAVVDGFTNSILERSQNSPFNYNFLYFQYSLAVAAGFSSFYAWYKYEEHKKISKMHGIELVQEFIEQKSKLEQVWISFQGEIENFSNKNNPQIQAHINEIQTAFEILQHQQVQQMFNDLNLNLEQSYLNAITQTAEMDAEIEQGYTRENFLNLTSNEDLNAVIASIDKIFTHIFAIQKIIGQQQNQVAQETSFISTMKNYARYGMSVVSNTVGKVSRRR